MKCYELCDWFSDRVDVMEMLIGAGSDVNVLNHKRHSPLQIAVAKPSKRCVTALVKHHSCNVNVQVLLLKNFYSYRDYFKVH